MMKDQAEKLRNLANALKRQVEADISADTLTEVQTPTDTTNQANTRVIAVTSGKGGVGKTNFTINLALALKALGQRVMVLDADLGLANVDLVLGVSPQYNLYHLLTGQKTIKEIVCEGPGGLQLIAGGSGMQELANLSKRKLDRFVNSLAELEGMADILIIDTGAGLSTQVLSFVMAADEVIVICTPEPTAITDAYGMVKTIYKRKPDSTVHLVVNRVTDEEEASVTAAKLTNVAQKFLKFPIVKLGYVLDDPAVVKAVKSQEPFVLKFPKSNAAYCVKQLASQLVHGTEKQQAPGGVRSFLNKIVGFFG